MGRTQAEHPPYGNLAGRIAPLIRIRPAVHLTAPWRHGYGKGTLLTQASKVAHVPAQLLLMILPLKLSWCSHRNIELRDTWRFPTAPQMPALSIRPLGQPPSADLPRVAQVIADEELLTYALTYPLSGLMLALWWKTLSGS